jgi:hypothetical protein
MYWRFDEEIQHVELDYPRDLPSVWRGVPADVDAAFRADPRDGSGGGSLGTGGGAISGETYFVRDGRYWRFDDVRMRAVEEGSAGERWMGCGAAAAASNRVPDPFDQHGDVAADAAPHVSSSPSMLAYLSVLCFSMARLTK